MDFADKMLKGISPTAQDWEAYLIDAHRKDPDMTSIFYKRFRSSEGLTSYETLAKALELVQTTAPAGLKVIDLACGDGYMLNALTDVKTVVGVDMSEDGLQLARRNFPNRRGAEFVKARAQELPFESTSIDAVLCHMAFMLMTPVEPVVSEISRVLKPGGVFSAVINAEPGPEDFDAQLRKVIWGFYQKTFPGLAKGAPTGDLRLYDADKLNAVFSAGDFDSEIELKDFSVQMVFTKDGFWESHRTLYFVSMLQPDYREQLKAELMAFFDSLADGRSEITYHHPMRRISVRKPKI